MDKVTAERVAMGLLRGIIAAMVMTGVRQVTTGLGLVEQTPPDAIIKQRAPGLLIRLPRVAYFVARREVAVIELAHWLYGATGGVAFALLPHRVLRSRWAGPGYGLLTTALFEFGVAPILGLDKSKKIRRVEQLMFVVDHLLYGIVLAGGREWAFPKKKGRRR